MKRVLVTGAAGFIGMHVSQVLLEQGHVVIGLDNFNDYYDVALKEARIRELQSTRAFRLIRGNVEDSELLRSLFHTEQPQAVVHLAAQAGVRYSLVNPEAYGHSNLMGFLSVLEACRHHGVEHLVFASSSSVYGGNRKVPFAIEDSVDHPVSLYAATKKANELMAHAYSHLFRLPVSGLRYFTVYGPWGRPDMAPMLFANAIVAGQPIDVFNNGDMRRDFTFVEDIAQGTVRVLWKPPALESPESQSSPTGAPYRIYNIGNAAPVELLRFIELLEAALGRRVEKRLLPMQPGDVPATFADVAALEQAVGFRPRTSIEEGVARFVAWFRKYYRVP